jgi:hypothetical protein
MDLVAGTPPAISGVVATHAAPIDIDFEDEVDFRATAAHP